MRKVVSKAVTAGGRFDFFLDSGLLITKFVVKVYIRRANMESTKDKNTDKINFAF